MSVPAHVERDVLEGNPEKILGIKRPGLGVEPYKRMLRRDPCSYCGTPGVYVELDHIQPRARGGANRWWNYTAACGGCNVLKFDDPMLYWLWRLRYELPEFIRAHLEAA